MAAGISKDFATFDVARSITNSFPMEMQPVRPDRPRSARRYRRLRERNPTGNLVSGSVDDGDARCVLIMGEDMFAIGEMMRRSFSDGDDGDQRVSQVQNADTTGLTLAV